MMASVTRRHDRFLVAHYFNPPYLVPLVEIVRSKHTSEETVQILFNLMKQIDKQPIICQKEALGLSGIGFSWYCGGRHITFFNAESPARKMWIWRSKTASDGGRRGRPPFDIFFEHNDEYDLTLFNQ